MTLDDQTLPARPGSIREEDVKLEEGHAVRESALSEGTFHQSQVVGKAIRKHFFCPPDATLADAVNRDADNVEFTDAEEKAVRRKIDRRVLTLVVSSYILNQFDRTNIGNAHVLKAFNDNFGITNNNQWTLALSIFYVGYCLLEMPANVLQRYIGANRFFFLSLTWWGLASVSVLLGIGEAGYYAGMIYYLSFWYKRSELALRISLCMTGTLPGAIGGLLAFGIVRIQTKVLVGWQLLFLVEAIPTIFMAIVTLLFLPSFPFSSSFLTPREKAIAQARLNRDHRPKSHGGMTGWEGFKAVVNDIHAWLLMFMYASFNVGATSIVYFLPTLINELGFSPLASQGLTVAPYVVGWLMVVFQAWHSDKTRDRGYHIMLSTVVSCIGYTVLAVLATRGSGSNMIGGRYFALFLVVGGNYSLFPLVMSWAANVFSPTSKRGVGTAFIVSISNCVSIASPQVYFDANDNYQKGHAISAACLFLTFLPSFVLRMRLARMNKKNAAKRLAMAAEGASVMEIAGLERNEEIYDNDARYVFMT